MKILSDFDLTVNAEQVEKQLDHIRSILPSKGDKEILKRIFSLIDLTTRSERDNL